MSKNISRPLSGQADMLKNNLSWKIEILHSVSISPDIMGKEQENVPQMTWNNRFAGSSYL